MELTQLVDFLANRLKDPLPGLEASNLMIPTTLDGQRIRMKHDTPPRESAVMVLFYEEEGEVRFPLIQRPQYPGVHSGQMALPGGRRELTDPDLFHTALRETEEEIGVAMKEVKLIGSLSSFFVAASNYQVLPAVGYLEERPEFIPEEKEVSEIVGARVGHLIDDAYRKETQIPVGGGVQLNSPYYDLEGRVVWGATAMMLSELKMILKEIND